MKCNFCKKEIKEEDKILQINLKRIHEDCRDDFIDFHIKKARKKSKPKKKKKKLPSWYKKKAIELAKKIAKDRDGYICMKCGKTRHQSQIQASHDISIGQCVWLAADPQNITTLCAYCHLRWWHSNPIESAEWHKTKFPERNAYITEIKKHQVKMNWEEVYNQLKKQYEK